MRKLRKLWIYVLASVLLVNTIACSNNELGQIAEKQQETGRAAELITQTIEVDSVGKLQDALVEAMGEEVGTLQKLILKGPISGEDWTFVRSLHELVVLDLSETKFESVGTYVAYGKSYAMKSDTINDRMFDSYSGSSFDKLESVVLPETIRRFEAYAFAHCKSLNYIELPDSTIVLGGKAFEYCEGLDSIKFNDKLRSLGDCAFRYCASLKKVSLPASLYWIYENAFYQCRGLETVEFKSIGNGLLSESLFERCSTLKKVKLPDDLKAIGEFCFQDCTSLTSIVFPDGLEKIGAQAFRGCSSLTEITIPQSVTSLGERIFSDCTSLKSVDIQANVKALTDYMFSSCHSLESVKLAKNITTLNQRAFVFCYALKDPTPFVHITHINGGYALEGCAFETFDMSNFKTLGTFTFQGCPNLRSVKFSDEVTSIPDGFFLGAGKLDELELPSGLKSIGYRAFESSKIEKIGIPSTVTDIASRAFSYTPLRELTIPASVTSVSSNFADDCSNLVALYWDSSIEVPYNNGTKNALLYLANDQIAYNRDSWKNVIMGGVAETIQLGYDPYDSWNTRRISHSFTCPKPFMAKKVTYKRQFNQITYPGKSSGWQTIVLPFTPDSILHESKGRIAPFESNVEGAKPFWLRELKADGFTDVTSIQPHTAYLIAMPNHSDYLNEYCLNGTITFMADSVSFGVTPDTLSSSVGPDFEFQPVYRKTPKAAGVYSLNIENWIQDYEYGGVFVRSLEDVYTFEAYVKTLGGGRSSRSAFDVDGRSKHTRAAWKRNNTGIPQIGDM